MNAYDKTDHEFCGKDVPSDVLSHGPRLVLVFSSGETQGSGFKARYTFETGNNFAYPSYFSFLCFCLLIFCVWEPAITLMKTDLCLY